MDLGELQRNWNELGQVTPLEAVLCPPLPDQQWDLEAFLATGEREVSALIGYLGSLGLALPGGVALDFGCGVGRVTQPLCRHFDVCYGVDIAPSILELARRLNRHGSKCRYVLNVSPRLEAFSDSSIDFVYSMITLQNIAPRYSAGYIAELVRVLAPNGLLVFQMPSRPTTIRTRIKQWVPSCLLQLFYWLRYRGRPRLELHGIDRERVVGLVEDSGGTIVDIQPYVKTPIGWSCYRYCVTK